MKQPQKELVRLKQIIFTDSAKIPNGTAELIKNDARTFFKNHFKLDEDSFNMVISVENDGSYSVNVAFNAHDMYDVKVIK